MTRLAGPKRPSLLPPRLRIWSGHAATEHAWLTERTQSTTTDIEAFLAEAPPSALRNSHYLAVILFLSLIIIASLIKVDVIVVGSGRLVADSPNIVVQPMQLSIIREIKVKAGDSVKHGDVLATLDPTFTDADLSALITRRDALQAEMTRLQSELDGRRFDYGDGGVDRELQLMLFIQRQSQYQARLAEFDQKIDSARTDIAAAERNRASLADQLAVAKDLQTMRGTLFESKVGSRINLLAAQVERMRTERELQTEVTRLSELEHALRSARAERQVFVDDWRRDLLERLVSVRSEDATLSESLAKARRLRDLVVLTAPEDAVVLEVAKRSVGSVLREAETLMTLVPAKAPLMAEVAISSADVGYAHAGDAVVVKVDAFPFQRHGYLTGSLRNIGEESIPSGGSAGAGALMYHPSQVALTHSALLGLPAGSRLIPGMTVSAEIEVGSRSVISFFLYPIIRSIRESMREP